MAKGRPRKSGARKNGRLVPAFANDRGTPERQAMRDLLRDPIQGADAIGRAYVFGLLGTGDCATDRLNGARSIARKYWWYISAHNGAHLHDSIGALQEGEGGPARDPQRDAAREKSLIGALDLIKETGGHDCRRAFDHLVIDLNPDAGPAWLDRIIEAERHRRAPCDRDGDMLRLALVGLDAIA